MRRPFAAVAALALLAGLVTLATPSVAASKTISGTVLGSDGRAVDVFMGFELRDASGRNIKADGSPVTQPGYVITKRINQDLGAEGSADRTGWVVRWSVTLPSNAAMMFIETYPRNAGQFGATNDIRYGRTLRRFNTPGSISNVTVRLPLQCAKGGGTGVITGTTKVGGVARQVNRVSAFSIGADNNAANPILGFNIGTSATNGSFRIPSLAPGTKYRVFARVGSTGTPKSMDVVVGRCAASRVNFSF